jgi:hypothetical protein
MTMAWFRLKHSERKKECDFVNVTVVWDWHVR